MSSVYATTAGSSATDRSPRKLKNKSFQVCPLTQGVGLLRRVILYHQGAGEELEIQWQKRIRVPLRKRLAWSGPIARRVRSRCASSISCWRRTVAGSTPYATYRSLNKRVVLNRTFAY